MARRSIVSMLVIGVTVLLPSSMSTMARSNGGDDVTPPTIVAETFPALIADWMNAPVTVTFRCSDASGIAFCSPPVTVTEEGPAQLVTGTAIDGAGNENTVSIAVGIDLTVPAVKLNRSAKETTTRRAEAIVRGHVSDALSGIAEATCNGQAASIVDGDTRCSVSLRLGVNDVILLARDIAGNSASASAQITYDPRSTTAISLTPARRTMLVNEPATLSLRDDAGVEVAKALWTSSDSRVVALSTDDPPLLTATGTGSATITAKKNGLTAEATIAVVPGLELSPGTVRWSVTPMPGLVMEPPIFTNRVDESVPEMFTVETETWGEATLRAIDAEGSVLWQQHSPGIPLMGDSFGGVIVGVLYDVNQGDDFQAYVRLGNAGGVAPWRYQSAGSLLRPAQGPDGTLYAIEFIYGGVDLLGKDIWDKHAIVIDGATGRLISRRPLARDVVAYQSARDGVKLINGVTCRTTRAEYAPETVGPIVGSDGRGYLLVRRQIRLGQGSCNERGSNFLPARTQDVGVDLIALSPTRTAIVQSLYALKCNAIEYQRTICDVPPDVFQLLPDGVEGLLTSWRRTARISNFRYFTQNYVSRIDAAGDRVDTPVAADFWIDLIGQAGTAYVRTPGGTRALDVISGTTKWTASLPGLGLIAARPDGGLATIDFAGDLHVFGPTGQEEELMPLGLSLSAVPELDGWIGLNAEGLSSVAGQFQDATRWTVEVGNRARQLAVRRPGMGIFLKSQDAVLKGLIAQHNSVRIVPFNQDWLASRPELQPRPGLDATDGFGNRYFTLGAGLPDGSDTGLNCGGGNLTKGINREGDIDKPVKALRKLPVAQVSEGATILSLLMHFNGYANDVPYWCTPGDPDSMTGLAYNSNSFAHGLLHAAGVSHPEREPRWPAPGWSLPLPSKYFRPRKATLHTR